MKSAASFFAFFACALVAGWSTSCSPGNKDLAVDTTYTVTVAMKGLDSGTLLLSYRIDNERKTDSASSTNGQYSFTGKADEPRKAYLSIAGIRGQSIPLYLENGKISITAHKDSLNDAVASGTRTNDDNVILQKQKAVVNERMQAFGEAYTAADKANQALLDSLEKQYEMIEKDGKAVSLSFVKEHPASLVSAYEVYDMFIYNPNVAEFDQAFSMLDSTVKASAIGKQTAKQLDISKRTDINQVAPDFTLNDVNDNPVALSSLRGKYLLIDFWASWCGPCRRENPNLVKTYQAFNKKGFEIVGVSLDNPGDRDKWLEAIKKDKLTWLQLSDLKGWQCAVAQQYGIMAIPMNFLLDPEGRIVAKGLRGQDLNSKLASLLTPATASN